MGSKEREMKAILVVNIPDDLTIDDVEVRGGVYSSRIDDGWIECRNPEGLTRDVSVDGYCSASIRKPMSLSERKEE